MSANVLCLGEAVIDVVIRDGSTSEHVGGSLLNVATGLAALGVPASLRAWWGKDERGARLAAWATAAGVTIMPGTDSAERTPVATAYLDADGHATYELDIPWGVPPLEDLSRFGHLHTGSIAATAEPGATTVVKAVRQIRETATVSYDPNIRPALMLAPQHVRERIEELVSLSDLVKASDEDLDWLYPDDPVEDVMRRWIQAGPAMVVVTFGSRGASALLPGSDDLLQINSVPVVVGDTVGAGDSFMAGLIAGLVAAGLLGSVEARTRLKDARWPDVLPALRNAAIASGITVSKNGAYAPTLGEVEAVRRAAPEFG